MCVVIAWAAAERTGSAGPLNPDAERKAEMITNFLLNGAGKGQAWDKLSEFVDTVGARVSGSAELEHAVSYMLDAMTKDGLDNVHGEAVTIPHWVQPRCTPHTRRCVGMSSRR